MVLLDNANKRTAGVSVSIPFRPYWQQLTKDRTRLLLLCVTAVHSKGCGRQSYNPVRAWFEILFFRNEILLAKITYFGTKLFFFGLVTFSKKTYWKLFQDDHMLLTVDPSCGRGGCNVSLISKLICINYLPLLWTYCAWGKKLRDRKPQFGFSRISIFVTVFFL